MIAGRGSADRQKRKMIAGRGSADRQKHEMIAGRASADGLKTKKNRRNGQFLCLYFGLMREKVYFYASLCNRP